MSRLRASGWRRRPVTLTPLIDIIFLLLLFFMLSSTFTRFAELPLQNAGGGAGAGETAPLFLRLLPESVELNGQPVALDTLRTALGSLRPEEDDTAVLLISLSEDVTSQRLVDLLTLLRREPWLTISVLG